MKWQEGGGVDVSIWNAISFITRTNDCTQLRVHVPNFKNIAMTLCVWDEFRSMNCDDLPNMSSYMYGYDVQYKFCL